MDSSGDIKNGKYRLNNYIISITNGRFSACEYIHFSRENLIREISHPAELIKGKDLLVIYRNNMHGKDTEYTPEDLLKIFSELPAWDQSGNFQIYDNDKNEIYISGNGAMERYSKLSFEIIK